MASVADADCCHEIVVTSRSHVRERRSCGHYPRKSAGRSSARSAKEHNVMLVGTSFPNIPPAVLDSSLETMAALQVVAKHVDLMPFPFWSRPNGANAAFIKKILQRVCPSQSRRRPDVGQKERDGLLLERAASCGQPLHVLGL